MVCRRTGRQMLLPPRRRTGVLLRAAYEQAFYRKSTILCRDENRKRNQFSRPALRGLTAIALATDRVDTVRSSAPDDRGRLLARRGKCSCHERRQTQTWLCGAPCSRAGQKILQRCRGA